MTLKRESAGDQLCLRISIHMPPRSLMFMWYMLQSMLAYVLGDNTQTFCLPSAEGDPRSREAARNAVSTRPCRA